MELQKGIVHFHEEHATRVKPDRRIKRTAPVSRDDEGQAEDIDAALAAVRAPAFPLTIAGVGCFDRGRQVHTVWAGVEAGPAIGHLYEKVESAAVRCGLEPERRNFKAHVTLARLRNTPVRRVGEYMQTRQGIFGGPFTADRFTLFRSHLGGEGALYEALQSNKIAGAALDCFDKEPLTADDPLIGMTNVVLTPHNAGMTPEAIINGLITAVQNVDDFFAQRGITPSSQVVQGTR